VHALRADVFCRELGWVGTPEDEAEWDEFDPSSTHVAVLDERAEVVAAVRVTGHDARWMLDSIFHALARTGLVEKRPGTAEASRLVVARRWRKMRLGSGMRTCDLLYKGAYAYCTTRAIRHVYMVTSDVVLRHMVRTGLPCEPLAGPIRMPDGVNAMTVKLDWTELPRSPALAAWYESGWRRPDVRRRARTVDGDAIERRQHVAPSPMAKPGASRDGFRVRLVG
jgi:N-acyl-L-homoserine lactone synthetase